MRIEATLLFLLSLSSFLDHHGVVVCAMKGIAAFAPPVKQHGMKKSLTKTTPLPPTRFFPSTPPLLPSIGSSSSTTALGVGFGGDGIFGVGGPEVLTIMIVAYFMLGPQEMYKATKQIGKFISTFRTVSGDAVKGVQDSLENQIELDTIRKAQRELNSAFGFRRSINQYEGDANFRGMKAEDIELGDEDLDVPVALRAKTNKKKRFRKRKVKKETSAPTETEMEPAMESPTVPDLEWPTDAAPATTELKDLQWPRDISETTNEVIPAAAAASTSTLREERMERLAKGTQSPPDWYKDNQADHEKPTGGENKEDVWMKEMEKQRFATQTGDWNEQIMANQEKLAPMEKLMQKLALLEEENRANVQRLEEEYAQRAQMENEYYRKRRALLEETAVEIQSNAYPELSDSNNKSNKKTEGSAAGEL